jgi:hypothetical protein
VVNINSNDNPIQIHKYHKKGGYGENINITTGEKKEKNWDNNTESFIFFIPKKIEFR